MTAKMAPARIDASYDHDRNQDDAQHEVTSWHSTTIRMTGLPLLVRAAVTTIRRRQ